MHYAQAVSSSLAQQLQLCWNIVHVGIAVLRNATTRSSVLKELCYSIFKAESTRHPFQVRCSSDDESSLRGVCLLPHALRLFGHIYPSLLTAS